MPRTFKLRGFTSEGYREARKAESSGVKKPLPEKSFLHNRSPKGKAPHRLLIFQRKPLLCPSEEREWERRKKKKKKNALGESWGSDKGWKGGVAFKFRGPTGLQRATPSGTGTRALFASGWEPRLPQLRDGDPLDSPARLLGCARVAEVSPPAPAPLTLCRGSNH